MQAARDRLAERSPAAVHTFSGTTASRLNTVLADRSITAVRVTTPVLRVDVPVTIRRSNLRLDLGATELRPAGDAPRFLLRIVDSSQVTVAGGAFSQGRWGVLVDRGSDVTLMDARFHGLREGGVAISAAHSTVIGRSRFAGLRGAAVLLHGTTERAVVLGNEMVANLGASNWHAGIVVTDRQAAVATDPASLLQADRYWAHEQPIRERLQAPRRNVIAQNRVAANASSGVYIDGAVENVIVDNIIEGNSKEGVCLDYGATANVLASNAIRQNGKRWGKSDDELKLDFVGGHGRLPDGTPPAKTPGISLDNALYNIVYANHVDRNFGGGVKMVRAAWSNLIGLNTVTDNNDGASDRFHFFGIELGAATADAPSSELDFAPSRGNIVFGNSVRGSHYAGLFFGEGPERRVRQYHLRRPRLGDRAAAAASECDAQQPDEPAVTPHRRRTRCTAARAVEGAGAVAISHGKSRRRDALEPIHGAVLTRYGACRTASTRLRRALPCPTPASGATP